MVVRERGGGGLSLHLMQSYTMKNTAFNKYILFERNSINLNQPLTGFSLSYRHFVHRLKTTAERFEGSQSK